MQIQLNSRQPSIQSEPFIDVNLTIKFSMKQLWNQPCFITFPFFYFLFILLLRKAVLLKLIKTKQRNQLSFVYVDSVGGFFFGRGQINAMTIFSIFSLIAMITRTNNLSHTRTHVREQTNKEFCKIFIPINNCIHNILYICMFLHVKRTVQKEKQGKIVYKY